MLDPVKLRKDLDETARRLAKRGFTLDIARIKSLEERRKELQVQTQTLQNGHRFQVRI